MSEYPEFLTKYFNWREDKKYLEAGSLKFGNTAEYRAAEDAMAMEARGDSHEGLSVFSDPPQLDDWPDDITKLTQQDWEKRADARRDYFKDVPKDVNLSGNQRIEVTNAWVFCATIGYYDAAHHELMKNGDPKTGYLGNGSLDGWCVFDTRKLVRALKLDLRLHPRFCRSNLFFQVLYGREVEYTWQQDHFSNAMEALDGPAKLTENEVVKRLTTKRRIFSTEREFRFIARIDERSCLPEHEPALIAESERIRESIVKFGQYKTK